MRACSAGLMLALLVGAQAQAQAMRGWPFDRDDSPPQIAAPPRFRLERSQPERGRVRPYVAPAEAGLALGLTRRARAELGYRFAPPEHSAPAGPVGESGRGTFLGIRRSLGP